MLFSELDSNVWYVIFACHAHIFYINIYFNYKNILILFRKQTFWSEKSRQAILASLIWRGMPVKSVY